MFAFIDETGNTGSNIFDKVQPDFLTGALISKTDFDVVYASSIRAIAAKVGSEQLHASVLGINKVDVVAAELLKILKKANARFFLSRVEKNYLLATKVFDTFFDSGENPAVRWSHYNIRPMRIILTFKVAALITDTIATDFWSMLMEKNEEMARAMLPRICRELINNVGVLPDQRSQDVITESLEWAAAHPEALHIHSNGKMARNGHLPNMVAFANLLDGLDQISKRWNRPVRRITHDRQSQFDAVLREWHQLFSNASDEPIHLPGETVVFQKVVGSTFDVKASSNSPGIQAIDLVLWLYVQHNKGKQFSPNAAKLLNFVFRRAYISDFSFKGVTQQMEAKFGHVLSRPLTSEQMAAAQEMIRKEEKARVQSIARFEEDGVVPYARNAELSKPN